MHKRMKKVILWTMAIYLVIGVATSVTIYTRHRLRGGKYGHNDRYAARDAYALGLLWPYYLALKLLHKTTE